MEGCKSITIRFKEEEKLYKQFIQAKAKLDAQREESGERKISCTDFAKKLLYAALREEGRE
ncbi:MAG TPA: hypothetical protein ENH14_01115 [candidate division WOR-3 bacterium]|uniref:CopG family transcriptional regulator n=1 Tax=candidate division WOR-3 bacterium TaxID=2052148 RepID=A0A7V0LU82_UNCW3|nr:hypothetical protein [candidate division WOR-3 bacterium]